MEDEIYKINHIAFNKDKTEFCFCYNDGFKVINIENFTEKNCSNNSETRLKSVSLSQVIPDNIIIFVGSKFNKDYPSNKIVFFDIVNKKEILSKTLEGDITNIKYVDNFLFICLDNDLKIFYYKNNELNLKDEINLSEEYKNLFEVWVTKEQNNIPDKVFISYPFKKDLIISFYTSDDWDLGNKNNIASPVKKIQNMFYIKKLNQLFITDENAIYIYSYDVDNGQVKFCLRRGSNPGFITSMTLLCDKFLAINNLNRTIHIFDLDIKNNAFSFSNIVYSMIYGIQEIYPCLRIYFKDLIKEKEGEFNKNDFNSKGAILVSEDDGKELNVIAYNGYAYKININLKDYKYELVLKKRYAEAKNLLLKDDKFKNINLKESTNQFSEDNK